MSVMIPSISTYNAVAAALLAVRRDGESKVNHTREAHYTAWGLVSMWLEANARAYADRYEDVGNPDEFATEEVGLLRECLDWNTPAPDPLQAAMYCHCLLYNCCDWPDWEGSEAQRTLQDFFADLIRPTRFGTGLALDWDEAYRAFYRSPEANKLEYCI